MEYFVKTFKNKRYCKDYYIEVLDEIEKLPLRAKTDAELETAYHFLKSPMVEYSQIIGGLNDFKNVKFRHELKFRDLLDISMFSQVYEELYQISLLERVRGLEADSKIFFRIARMRLNYCVYSWIYSKTI